MEEAPSNKNKLIAIAGLVVIVAAIGAAIALGSGNKETASNTPTPSAVSQASPSPQSSGTVSDAETSAYKDGTYTATGDYRSPGGSQQIEVTVTVKDGKVTETSAKEMASDDASKQYQEKFIANYKSLVVGKSLDEVSLSKVSGSSLTGTGFNDAIDQIKTDAKG